MSAQKTEAERAQDLLIRQDANHLTVPERERFWGQVSRTNACWAWTGRVDHHGYGVFTARQLDLRAHRVAFELTRGFGIATGLVIDHLCHNPNCVRPGHLREVTQAVNAQNLSGAHSDSQSGRRGVSWDRARKKWRADICVGGKRKSLGRFESLSEATAAAESARRALFEEAAA